MMAPGLTAWRSPDTLVISSLLLACLVAVVFLPVTFSSRARAAQDALFLRADPLQEYGQSLNAAMLDMEAGERGFLLTGNISLLAPYSTGQQDFAVAVAGAQPLARAVGSAVSQTFAAAIAAAQTWQNAAGTAVASRRAGGQPDEGGSGQLFDAYRAAYAPFDALLVSNRRAARDNIRSIEQYRNAATAAAGIAVALLALAYFRLLVQRARLRTAEQRSAHYIRRLMDSLRDPVIVIDVQTRLVRDANRAAEEMSGYDRGELLGMPAARLRVPAERDAPQDLPAAGEPVPQRVTWQRRDGTTAPMEFISALATFNNEQVIVASGRDIQRRLEDEAEREALLRQTEIARAQAETSERRYRVLAETMPQIVWAAEPDGTIDYYNQRFYDYTGLAPGQARDDGGWAQVVHPDDLPRTLGHWSHALHSGTTMEQEFRLRRGSDRAYRWHLARAVPVHDDAGEIGRWLGVCVDIDDRRRASEEVRQSRDHLAAVFGSIHDGIVVLDPRGCIVTANEAAARALGYSSPEAAVGRMLGEGDLGLVVLDEAGEPLPDEEFPAQRVLSGAADAEALVRMAAGSGEERWLLVRATPLCGADGRIENAIVSFHDITERQQAEELRRVAGNLTRSNAALQEFAYVASHDLQEPLRMVASYTQLLQRRYQGRLDADADDFIRYAVDGATRMKQLIHDLLAYSRVETRGGSLQVVDCNTVVEQVLHDLSLAIAESGATVDVRPLPVLYGDPTQLRQVFQNLIGNAVKFRGETPPIVRVGCERRAAELIFSVADNGIGIDPQYAERIFVVFQRLHTRDAYPGTGIGLALCKKIVERHGGRIWLESRAGEGAIFFFALPALAEGRAAELREIQA